MSKTTDRQSSATAPYEKLLAEEADPIQKNRLVIHGLEILINNKVEHRSPEERRKDACRKAGKASGTIIIPSSLDMAETAIVASSLETIQRVGPCNAKMHVRDIEDVRVSKREYVVERAKEAIYKINNDAKIELIPVYTNIRRLCDERSLWLDSFFGAVLASIAHTFSNKLNMVFIGSSLSGSRLSFHLLY